MLIIYAMYPSSDVVMKPLVTSHNQDILSPPHKKLLSHEEYCNALLAHGKGHWQHTSYETFAQLIASNPSIKILHFPKELDWMKGCVPWNGFGTYKWERNMLMYNGLVGHQCGCVVRVFQPSLSEWVLNTTARPNTPDNPKENAAFHPSWTEYYKTSATLCLARNWQMPTQHFASREIVSIIKFMMPCKTISKEYLSFMQCIMPAILIL